MMKKPFFILSSALLFAGSGVAQTLELIGAAGEEAQNAQTQISYSIGELIVDEGNGNDFSVTQGYQQSNLTVTGVNNPEVSEMMRIYPNPTSDFIILESLEIDQIESLQLFDEKAALVWSNEKPNSDRVQISLESYAAGIYFLNVKTNTSKTPSQYKIIKAQ
jgi:hypothetical protein